MSMKYPNNYTKAVQNGEVIEDFVCDKDGWIWWDEVGMLGAHRVYDTEKEALDDLDDYCFHFLWHGQ